MNDTLVSIRMPAGLARRLKSLSEKNFYMDISEQIRAVLNKRFLEDKERRLLTPKKRENTSKKAKELEAMLERNEQLLKELKESLRTLK